MRTIILLLLSFSSFAQVDTSAKKYSFGPNRLKDTAWNKANTRLDGNLNLRSLTFVDSLHYLGIDANNNVKLYPISAIVSGVVSVNGQTGVVSLDIPFYADSIKKNFDSILAHNLRLINLQYGVDTAKQNIRNEISSLHIPYYADSIIQAFDSLTAHNSRLIMLRYKIDTGIANVYSWAWSTFLTSYTETDPLSFHKVDSNTAGGAVTYSYFWTNTPSLSGYLQLSDTVNNVSTRSWRQKGIDSVNVNIALKANIASPALTGTPTAPTAAINNNSTQIATTEYVDRYFPADTTISAAYTLTSRDFHRTIHCTNGSNIALTIPTGLGTTFECVVLAEGAGTVTPTTSSTTFYYQPTSTTKIKSQGGATIRSWATANSYLIIGSLE